MWRRWSLEAHLGHAYGVAPEVSIGLTRGIASTSMEYSVVVALLGRNWI